MNYKQVWLKSRGLTEGDIILCEVCGQSAADIHHIIPKGMGGTKRKYTGDILIALCRHDHDRAGGLRQPKLEKEYLLEIAKKNIDKASV